MCTWLQFYICCNELSVLNLPSSCRMSIGNSYRTSDLSYTLGLPRRSGGSPPFLFANSFLRASISSCMSLLAPLVRMILIPSFSRACSSLKVCLQTKHSETQVWKLEITGIGLPYVVSSATNSTKLIKCHLRRSQSRRLTGWAFLSHQSPCTFSPAGIRPFQSCLLAGRWLSSLTSLLCWCWGSFVPGCQKVCLPQSRLAFLRCLPPSSSSAEKSIASD